MLLIGREYSIVGDKSFFLRELWSRLTPGIRDPTFSSPACPIEAHKVRIDH